MDSSQRIKLIIGGVIVLALVGVALWVWSDSIFPEGTGPEPTAVTAPGDDGGSAGSASKNPPPPPVSGGKMLAPQK